MKQLACGVGVALALLTAAVLGGPQDDKTPTIKDVMGKLHKGANSPLATLKTALKADTPDWKAIQEKTKNFVTLGAALEKNDPPKGEKAAWKKFAGDYLTEAKALDDAAKAEDKKAAQAGTRQTGRLLQGMPRRPQGELSSPSRGPVAMRPAHFDLRFARHRTGAMRNWASASASPTARSRARTPHCPPPSAGLSPFGRRSASKTRL
jgi:hypothetical protein